MDKKKEILKKYTGKGGPLMSKIGNGVRSALLNNPVGKATSAVMGGYYNLKAKRAMGKADQDVNRLKRARAYDNAPDYNEDGSVTDAFKARSLANEVKDRLRKSVKSTIQPPAVASTGKSIEDDTIDMYNKRIKKQ